MKDPKIPTQLIHDHIELLAQINFEAGRSMPDDPYERGKRPLHGKAMAADEWQAECKDTARGCGV